MFLWQQAGLIFLLSFISRGSALSRRMRDRELEIQADARDKQREMEEIEEVLRKQMNGEPVETPKKPSYENKENLVCIFFKILTGNV